MEDFSLRTCLIPELLKNKIDFRIIKYENGNPEKPTSLVVCDKYIDICRVDNKSVRAPFEPDCYDIMWHLKTPGCFDTSYSRAIDLVSDICKVMDFNFKGENKMNKKIYQVTDVEFRTSPINEINFTVDILRSKCDVREDFKKIRDAIESICDTNASSEYRYNYHGGFTTWRNEYQKERAKFDIKDVIFNNPATIVFWSDGTKTVVKAENEPFDPEKGLAMAIAKRALGNNYEYYDIFKKYVGKYEKKQKKGN